MIILDEIIEKAPKEEYSVPMFHLNEYTPYGDEVEIKEFIHSHDIIYKALSDAPSKIKEVFKQHVIKLGLEYIRDPEEDFDCLFITIHTKLPPEMALDLIDKLNDTWWLQNDSGIREILGINTRYE